VDHLWWFNDGSVTERRARAKQPRIRLPVWRLVKSRVVV
jgi:hypothetical protein